MKRFFVLVAATLTLTACQLMPVEQTQAPVPIQDTHEQLQIREAQSGLKQLGYYRSRVDGISGPRTRAAIQRARADFGLDLAGGLDSEFTDVMDRYLALNPPRKGIPLAADTFAAQRNLKRLGYYGGRVNGLYDGATLTAVLAYRRHTGLPITEKIDARLLRQLEGDTARATSI